MLKIPHLNNWLEQLPTTVLNETQQIMTRRKLVDGEMLYNIGDKSNNLYQIVSGKINMCNYSLDGKELIVASFLPGDCFGEAGVIDGLPRICNTPAVGDTELRVLEKRHFDTLCLKYPEINRQLNIMFCRHIRMFYTMTEDTLLLNLHQRLARHIHRLALSQGNNAEGDEVLVRNISHDELGRTLGVSRQSISKELKQLEQEGIIEIRYGKVFVRDIATLGKAYGQLIGHEQLVPDYCNE